jgi:hypothetical protein
MILTKNNVEELNHYSCSASDCFNLCQIKIIDNTVNFFSIDFQIGNDKYWFYGSEDNNIFSITINYTKQIYKSNFVSIPLTELKTYLEAFLERVLKLKIFI